jgi:hypothetical protein
VRDHARPCRHLPFPHLFHRQLFALSTAPQRTGTYLPCIHKGPLSPSHTPACTSTPLHPVPAPQHEVAAVYSLRWHPPPPTCWLLHLQGMHPSFSVKPHQKRLRGHTTLPPVPPAVDLLMHTVLDPIIHSPLVCARDPRYGKASAARPFVPCNVCADEPPCQSYLLPHPKAVDCPL